MSNPLSQNSIEDGLFAEPPAKLKTPIKPPRANRQPLDLGYKKHKPAPLRIPRASKPAPLRIPQVKPKTLLPGGKILGKPAARASALKLSPLRGIGRVLGPLNAYGAFLDIADWAESKAPGVQDWLTGGWKGDGRTYPNTTVPTNILGGQTPGTTYRVFFSWTYYTSASTLSTSSQSSSAVLVGPLSILDNIRKGKQTSFVNPPNYLVIKHANGSQNTCSESWGIVANSIAISIVRLSGPSGDESKPIKYLAPDPRVQKPQPKRSNRPKPTGIPVPRRKSSPIPQSTPQATDLPSPSPRPETLVPPTGTPPRNPTPTPTQVPASQPAPQPNTPTTTTNAPAPNPDCRPDPCTSDLQNVTRFNAERLLMLLQVANEIYRLISNLLELFNQKFGDCDPCEKKTEEPTKSAEIELEQIELPYVTCANENSQEILYPLTVLKGSVPLFIRQQFINSANLAIKGCEQQRDYIIAPPEHINIRKGSGIPQLVVVFRERDSDGKWGRGPYRITIPHYSGPNKKKPDLPDFRKGNYQGSLRYVDNSRTFVYASSMTEAKRVIGKVKRLVPKGMIDRAYPERYGEIRGSFEDPRVTFYKASYYSNGLKNKSPDWEVFYNDD
jgi:hypothetical protein